MSAVSGVVLAAGSGQRFGSPKQYARLAGERLVDRAVRLLQRFAEQIVVVLPEGDRWDGPPVHASVAGGASRTESLRRALAVLPEAAECVIVHDVVRPLATGATLRLLIQALADGADAAIPVWQTPDTLKTFLADGRISHAGREGLGVAQGPIAFRAAALRRLFAELEEIPVEETVGLERTGGRLVAVPGDRWSHHVVEPRDLALMEGIVGIVDAEDSD